MTPTTPVSTDAPVDYSTASMAEIAALLTDAPAAPEAKADAPVATEPDTKTPEAEPAQPSAAEPLKAESGTTKEPEPKEESIEEKEEPLPPNVQKRIAKEVAIQARIDREILEAVSARKSKEAELARLKSEAGTGSEPVPNTAPANTEPVEPKLEDFTGDQSFSEYKVAEEKYKREYKTWLVAETRKAAAEEFTAKQRESEGKRQWEDAVKTMPDLPAARDFVVSTASEAFVTALSQLDHWAKVTEYLGANPEELKSFDARFKQNPYTAVAALGKLEDRLTAEPKPSAPAATPKARPLPAPPAKLGGAAALTAELDLNKASTTEFNRWMAGQLTS